MRLLFGALLLATLFLAATLWQKSWTSAARAERSAGRGETSLAVNDLPAGWSRVVVGRPSGAEPYHGVSLAGPPLEPAGAPAARQSSPRPSVSTVTPGNSSEVIVQSGQSLSTICREHYGTARVEVVEAVSRHNRLASPDTVREGQRLELPALDQLLPKR